MYEVKLVPKPATVYVSSKARPLQLFQMFTEVVAVCCAHKKLLQVSEVNSVAGFIVLYWIVISIIKPGGSSPASWQHWFAGLTL